MSTKVFNNIDVEKITGFPDGLNEANVSLSDLKTLVEKQVEPELERLVSNVKELKRYYRLERLWLT
jgi:hypothetical protein